MFMKYLPPAANGQIIFLRLMFHLFLQLGDRYSVFLSFGIIIPCRGFFRYR